MRPPTDDSTAGRRAREISAYRDARHRIVDATNPRFGKRFVDREERAPQSAGEQPLEESGPERDALSA